MEQIPVVRVGGPDAAIHIVLGLVRPVVANLLLEVPGVVIQETRVVEITAPDARAIGCGRGDIGSRREREVVHRATGRVELVDRGAIRTVQAGEVDIAIRSDRRTFGYHARHRVAGDLVVARIELDDVLAVRLRDPEVRRWRRC